LPASTASDPTSLTATRRSCTSLPSRPRLARSRSRRSPSTRSRSRSCRRSGRFWRRPGRYQCTTGSAKVYLTNLYNPALPLIRYEITDEVTLLEDPCPCGSAHRLVEDIQGRLDDTFFYPGLGAVHPHVFRSRLGREHGIVEYQVRQTARGAAIAIRCRGKVDFASLQADIAFYLARLGLENPEVSGEPVESLDRHSSGKLKRFVPLAVGQR
jgi:phenylacetate-coenzyme A ligase PaaK-like adenylate-forming protein